MNFALVPLSSFEINFLFITLSHLQYNKVPGFTTKVIFFFFSFLFFFSYQQNSATKALVLRDFCVWLVSWFWREGIYSHRLKEGRKGEGLTLSKEGQKHNLQVRQESSCICWPITTTSWRIYQQYENYVHQMSSDATGSQISLGSMQESLLSLLPYFMLNSKMSSTGHHQG